jgi:DNA end-binding protein Ku
VRELRAIQKTTLKFGSFQIPVKIATLQKSNSISFNNICPKCNSKIQYKKVCLQCNKEVPYEEIAKGYKIGDEMYKFSKDQIQAIKQVMNKDISVVKVVDTMDFTRFEKSYWLLPNEVESKYVLLRDILKCSSKMLEVKFTLRDSESLGIIWVNQNHLVLTKMVYPDEVVTPDEAISTSVSDELLKKGIELLNKVRENTKSNLIENSFKMEFKKVLEKVISGEELKLPEIEEKQVQNLEAELETALA